MTPGRKAWAAATEELADIERIAMTDELREQTREAVKGAIKCWGSCTPDGPLGCKCQQSADAAIAVVLEEAARVARPPAHMLGSADSYANGYRAACSEIAAAIRALISSDAGGS